MKVPHTGMQTVLLAVREQVLQYSIRAFSVIEKILSCLASQELYPAIYIAYNSISLTGP